MALGLELAWMLSLLAMLLSAYITYASWNREQKTLVSFALASTTHADPN